MNKITPVGTIHVFNRSYYLVNVNNDPVYVESPTGKEFLGWRFSVVPKINGGGVYPHIRDIITTAFSIEYDSPNAIQVRGWNSFEDEVLETAELEVLEVEKW